MAMKALCFVLATLAVIAVGGLTLDRAVAKSSATQATSDQVLPAAEASCRRWGWHGYGTYPCKCIKCKWKAPGAWLPRYRYCWRVC
jgi:hypothetical protein